jgi:hypothetical protein
VLLIGGASGVGKSQGGYRWRGSSGGIGAGDRRSGHRAQGGNHEAQRWSRVGSSSLTVAVNDSLQSVFDAVIADHLTG